MQIAKTGAGGPAAARGRCFAGERDPWANAANAAALVFEALPDLNWAGFYFLRGGELVVGPFQGRVACVRIPLGQGVCGTAAANGARRSSSPTCTSSRATSPAMRPRTPRSWCRSSPASG